MARRRNQVLWSPAARNDLIEIWQYFAGIASPDVADRLLSEIEAAASRLADEPRMFRARADLMPDLPGGLRSIPVHPYLIFYRIAPQITDDEDQDVQVIRVLHERRDPFTLRNER